jgi:DNA-binding transcriptional LysR family regulator
VAREATAREAPAVAAAFAGLALPVIATGSFEDAALSGGLLRLLPGLLHGRRLASDRRLKIVPAPVDLGTFPVEMAWHIRYRDDPAHSWLRALIVEAAKEVAR